MRCHVSDMSTTFPHAFSHEVIYICIIHRNNDLLSRWAFDCHIYVRFKLVIAIDHLLNAINVVSLKSGKGFLDFENTFSIASAFRSLCV